LTRVAHQDFEDHYICLAGEQERPESGMVDQVVGTDHLQHATNPEDFSVMGSKKFSSRFAAAGLLFSQLFIIWTVYKETNQKA
jgi:hypothetical protein